MRHALSCHALFCVYIYRPSQLGPALFNGHCPLGMSNANANAMKQLRGPKHEIWPVWGPRAAPPGEYGLTSGGNGHLARPNGAVDGPYCSPTWPSACRRRCEPLIGRGGGYGVWGLELHQRRHSRLGVLLQLVAKKNARRPGLPASGAPRTHFTYMK
jgi:hypothetical protein